MILLDIQNIVNANHSQLNTFKNIYSLKKSKNEIFITDIKEIKMEMVKIIIAGSLIQSGNFLFINGC
jgi:hypothetical protein